MIFIKISWREDKKLTERGFVMFYIKIMSSFLLEHFFSRAPWLGREINSTNRPGFCGGMDVFYSKAKNSSSWPVFRIYLINVIIFYLRKAWDKLYQHTEQRLGVGSFSCIRLVSSMGCLWALSQESQHNNFFYVH